MTNFWSGFVNLVVTRYDLIMMKQFDIVTIFPQIFDSYFAESIIKRAQNKKLIKINVHDLRKYSTAKSKLHRSVDDRPYGGGPGMILLVEPIAKALKAIKRQPKSRVLMMSPAGKKFTQREAERLSKYDQLILLCGRYEGFDARVDKLIDEKISIGDYVLAGGELPAMIVTEAVSRNISGVVGHEHALDDETFSHDLDYIEYPQYSRPEDFKGMKVPKILLSGNHAAIKKWREEKSKKRK
jgi:tRNA (guanine37-N1)-methyltransferase